MPVQAGRKVVRPRTRDGAAASVASVDGRAEKAMDEKEVLEEMARLMTKTGAYMALRRCRCMVKGPRRRNRRPLSLTSRPTTSICRAV